MRFRLFICLMGTLLLPATGNALLVSDLPGTFQAATEVGNTVNSWKESVSQATAIQKTVAAVGTAKKGLTSAMTAISDFKAQVAEYQSQIAQAQADIQAAANQAKAAADTVKNAPDIAKGLADRAVNSVKDTASSTINGVKDTAMGTVNSVKGTVDSVKDQAVGIGESAGIQSKNAEVSSDGPESEAGENGNAGYVAGSSGGLAAKASASDIVDVPSQAPSRMAINMGSASVAAVSGGTAQRMAGVASQAAPLDAMAPVSAAGSVAPLDAIAPVSAAGSVAPLDAIAPVSAAGSVAPLDTIAPAGAVKQAVAAPQAIAAQPMEAVQTLNKAELIRPAADGISAAQISKAKEAPAALKMSAPTENGPILKAQNVLQQGAEAVRQTGKEIKPLQNATLEKAVQADTVKKELKQDIKAVPANLEVNQQNLKTPAQKIDNSSLKQVTPQLETQKDIRPVRASFKTSAGYGQIKTSTPLAFAQLSVKGGTAMGNIMIVPRDVFIYCGLDHEQAAQKDKYDACLKKINDVRMSEVSEEVTKEMIDEATRVLYNGYAEMLAAGFFEAFEIYNDSVDFYHKQIHPNQEVNNQRITDAASGWSLAKDMNGLLDGRLNALNKLWGRQLLTKGFEQYVFSGIQTAEEENTKKAPLNTNMYGKVIISSVLADRCGISVTKPQIDDDCLKILASDYQDGSEYGSWEAERKKISNEYASAAVQRASQALAASGDNFKNIADLTGMDLSSTENLLEPDILKKITDNNAVANAVAAKILDAEDLRSSTVMIDNIRQLLTNLVPVINANKTAL